MLKIWDLRGGCGGSKLSGRKKKEHSQGTAILEVTGITFKKKMTLRVGSPFEEGEEKKRKKNRAVIQNKKGNRTALILPLKQWKFMACIWM